MLRVSHSDGRRRIFSCFSLRGRFLFFQLHAGVVAKILYRDDRRARAAAAEVSAVDGGGGGGGGGCGGEAAVTVRIGSKNINEKPSK